MNKTGKLTSKQEPSKKWAKIVNFGEFVPFNFNQGLNTIKVIFDTLIARIDEAFEDDDDMLEYYDPEIVDLAEKLMYDAPTLNHIKKVITVIGETEDITDLKWVFEVLIKSYKRYLSDIEDGALDWCNFICLLASYFELSLFGFDLDKEIQEEVSECKSDVEAAKISLDYMYACAIGTDLVGSYKILWKKLEIYKSRFPGSSKEIEMIRGLIYETVGSFCDVALKRME